jgi:hypothetical protein
VHAFVVRNVERLVEALHYYRLVCDQLILSLLFTDAPEQSRRASLLGSTSGFERLLEAALELLPRTWQPPHAAVHYMHVIAGQLRPAARRQLGLFDYREQQRTLVAELKRTINDRAGRFALRSGSTLSLADVYGDPANAYDICDIYGKMCF